MKGRIAITAAIAISTLLPLSASPEDAAPGDDPLVAQARQIMDRFPDRGTWSNAMMPTASDGRDEQSADTVMSSVLAGYTRALLDRGGWTNAYVNTGSYDAGHPLLAVALGDGAGTRRGSR